MHRTKQVIKAIGGVLTISILVIIFLVIFNATLFKATIAQSIINWGLFAVAIYAFLLDLIPQNFSTHIVILLTYFLGINSLLSILVILISGALSSLFGFWLGKSVEKDFFEDIAGKNISKNVEKAMKKYGNWYVLVSAISPLPYIPILFGAFDMKWRNFIIWGLIPRILGFMVNALFAGQIIDFLNGYFPTLG